MFRNILAAAQIVNHMTQQFHSYYTSQENEKHMTTRNLNISVHSCVIHISQIVETPQVSVSWWMGKQKCILSIDWIKRCGVLIIGFNTNEPWNILIFAKVNGKRLHSVWFSLYEVSKAGTFGDTETAVVIV